MGTSETAVDSDGQVPALGYPVPAFVDWIAGAAVAVVGLALLVGGSALTFVVDREMIREDIESGEITVILFERELTEAQMLEFTTEVVSWTGTGLLATGALLVLFAVGYVAVRHRAHQRTGDGEVAGNYLAAAVLGAIATTVLSFIPFSPVVGGGVAGYLEGHETSRSVSVGGVSGLLSMVPGLVILLFVTVGLYAGLSDVGEGDFGIVVATAMLLVMLVVAAYGAGLGALGGFAGGRLSERERERERERDMER